MYARNDKLLSLKLRSIGLAQINRVWYYAEWPIAGKYTRDTTSEALSDGSASVVSGTSCSYDKSIL